MMLKLHHRIRGLVHHMYTGLHSDKTHFDQQEEAGSAHLPLHREEQLGVRPLSHPVHNTGPVHQLVLNYSLLEKTDVMGVGLDAKAKGIIANCDGFPVVPVCLSCLCPVLCFLVPVLLLLVVGVQSLLEVLSGETVTFPRPSEDSEYLSLSC